MRRGHKAARITITAWTLRWTALGVHSATTPFGRTILHSVQLSHLPRKAAPIVALFIVVPTITLFARFHNLVPAKRTFRSFETVSLLAIMYRVQHVTDVGHAARRKFTIVGPIATRGRRKHNVVAVQSARPTIARIIVWRAEIVANLMSERQLRHFGWHARIVIDERNDARVQAPFRRLVNAANRFRVRFVLLTNSARCA